MYCDIQRKYCGLIGEHLYYYQLTNTSIDCQMVTGNHREPRRLPTRSIWRTLPLLILARCEQRSLPVSSRCLHLVCNWLGALFHIVLPIAEDCTAGSDQRAVWR